ncbi:hypothetical protein SRB17_88530 [Streptomyces sp. RB17]|nr:hypothetical protein [Streptomyces sp. RB17]
MCASRTIDRWPSPRTPARDGDLGEWRARTQWHCGRPVPVGRMPPRTWHGHAAGRPRGSTEGRPLTQEMPANGENRPDRGRRDMEPLARAVACRVGHAPSTHMRRRPLRTVGSIFIVSAGRCGEPPSPRAKPARSHDPLRSTGRGRMLPSPLLPAAASWLPRSGLGSPRRSFRRPPTTACPGGLPILPDPVSLKPYPCVRGSPSKCRQTETPESSSASASADSPAASHTCEVQGQNRETKEHDVG